MGQKQKTEKKKKKKKKERRRRRANDGDNNGQATHGARKPPGPKVSEHNDQLRFCPRPRVAHASNLDQPTFCDALICDPPFFRTIFLTFLRRKNPLCQQPSFSPCNLEERMLEGGAKKRIITEL